MIVFVNASGYIHTSEAETYQPIAEIVDELGDTDIMARETGKISLLITAWARMSMLKMAGWGVPAFDGCPQVFPGPQ